MNYKGGGGKSRSTEQGKMTIVLLACPTVSKGGQWDTAKGYVLSVHRSWVQSPAQRKGQGKCQKGYWEKLTVLTAALRQLASLHSCVHIALLRIHLVITAFLLKHGTTSICRSKLVFAYEQ